jgi:polyphosphate kinase
LKDNTKARLLQADGNYVRAPKSGAAFSAQDYFTEMACEPVAETPGKVATKKAGKKEVIS